MAACSTACSRREDDRSPPVAPRCRALPRHSGVTLLWLSLIVLLPLASLALRPWELGIVGVWHSITEPRVLAALRLSFGAAALAAAVNVPLGLLIAWVMVRYRFPGRSLADSLIDMPLALPTAVAGIALTALFAPNGWIGALLAPLGIKVAYTPLGILVALIFVGLPFVVRTLEPVIMDLPTRRRGGRRNARGDAARRRCAASCCRRSAPRCWPASARPWRAASANTAR